MHTYYYRDIEKNINGDPNYIAEQELIVNDYGSKVISIRVSEEDDNSSVIFLPVSEIDSLVAALLKIKRRYLHIPPLDQQIAHERGDNTTYNDKE